MGIGAQLRALGRLGMITGGSAILLGAWEVHSALMADERAEGRFLEAYRKRFAELLLTSFGAEVYTDLVPKKARRARLIVANHRAILDIPILLDRFGGTLLSKAEVAQWPLAGTMASRARTIFVDRDDQSSGVRAIRAMRAALEEGLTLSVFPEGTVHAGDEIQEFRAGAFLAAKGLDVEILPVGLAYPSDVEWGGRDLREHLSALLGRDRTPVGLAIGEPFMADARGALLAKEAKERVQRLVIEARERLSAAAR